MTSRELVAVVLTALPVEMAAVLARLGENRSVTLAGPVLCEIGSFTASNGRSWRVAAAEIGPGTVDTAGAVVALTARFGPDVLMFAGIAGALTGDVAIGDVVAGTEVAWTERGRWSAGGYQARIRTVSLSPVLTQLARKIAREGSWTGRLTRPRPGAKAVVAQIACGEKVVADNEYRAWLRATFSDAVAIENEGFALARAGELHADGHQYVVRGICDNADGSKSDDGHGAAADAAAAFAFELLDAYSAHALADLQADLASPDRVPPAVPAAARTGAGPAGHAFLCYDRDDSPAVDRLAQTLARAGLPVWRDTADLWPGQDWGAEIRRAITGDALAFLACFSRHGLSKARTYQYEELTLAADQMRQMRPGLPWLIPVRLDDCDLPDLDLGAGRTLTSLHRADLFGEHADQNLTTLIAIVRQILRHPGPADSASSPSQPGRPPVAGRSQNAAQEVPTMMGDGMFLVGPDVQPGVYRTCDPSPSPADRLHAVVRAILAHFVPASGPRQRGMLPLVVELALCCAIDEFGRSAGKASLTSPLLEPEGFLAGQEIAAILARALTGGYLEGAPTLGRAWARALLDGTRADELITDAENLLGYLWAQAQTLRPLADLAGSLAAQTPGAREASPAAAPWVAPRERPPQVNEMELRMRLALARERIADFDRVAACDIGRSRRNLPPELRFFLNDQTLLVANASRDFVGREPVLAQVKAFIEGDEDGYCFVLAKLGVGKTALLARLVAGQPGYVRHFNVLSEGVRTAEQFLNNVCAQLIGAYRLDPSLFPKSGNANTDLLRRLLTESAAKTRGEKVVVVIDALDEAMTEARLPGINPLSLPRSLPEGCRFIVTVRDGTEGWEPALDAGCAARMLCVKVNSDENMNDARTYVRSRLASPGIARYLMKQNLASEEFADEVASRSEGYFVYLRHVLDQYDAGGELASRELADLPAGLTPYYDDQYERMRADTPQRQWEQVGLPVLIQLAIAEQPLTLYQLASGAGRRKAAPVMTTIEQWRQFLVVTSASWNGRQVPAYRLFHESFREFLKKKHEHAAEVAEVERALREDLGRQARARYGRGGPSAL